MPGNREERLQLAGLNDPGRAYHHADLGQRDAGFRAYLAWELGLVEQLQRADETGFRLLPSAD